jgi:L-aminopeptidase/D-esterase-like protein
LNEYYSNARIIILQFNPRDMHRLKRKTGKTNTLTDVEGVRIGNFTDPDILSGVTVIFPDVRAAAGVDIRGGAPGTREVPLLDPVNLVQKVDAIVLSGGSSYGLSASTGVMDYLEELGRGYTTRKGEIVPIVTSAILYDLYRGEKQGKISSRGGYLACLNIGKPPKQGNTGAGTGVVSGGIKGGLGTASEVIEKGACVGAIVAVNSAGHTCDPLYGGFYARSLGLEEEYRDLEHLPIDSSIMHTMDAGAGECTVLGVVATDVCLSKVELTKVAQMAQDGVARAVRPAHTMYDGDTVFALSTGKIKHPGERASVISQIGHVAADTLSRSIIHGVLEAESVNGIMSYREKFDLA